MKALNVICIIQLLNMLFNTHFINAQNIQLITEKVFGGTGSDTYPLLLSISDDRMIIVGSSDSNIGGNMTDPPCTPDTSDIWMVGIDSSLNIEWDRSLGGNKREWNIHPYQFGSKYFLLSSNSNSDSSCQKSSNNNSPNVSSDYWISFLDSAGQLLWELSIGGTGMDMNPHCIQLSDSNIIVAGKSNGGIGGDKTVNEFGWGDYWLVKFDTNGVKLWDNVYGGSGYELSNDPGTGFDIISCAQNRFYLIGTSNSGISGNVTTNNIGGFPNHDWIVWLIDSNGVILWQSRYGGVGHDYFNQITKTQDGGYLLIGGTSSPAGYSVTDPPIGDMDCWIVKVDSLFNIQWDHRFGGIGIDDCVCGKESPNGGFYIGGITCSPMGFDVSEPPYSSSDYWVFEIDSLGNKLWDKRFGGSGVNILVNFAILPDTSIILSGLSNYGSSPVKSFPGYGLSDYWLVHMKYNDSLTSTNEPVLSQQVHLYPNPSSGALQIPDFLRDASVTISDVTGRGIVEIPIPESTTLDLSYLPNGCYHFRFVTKQGNYYAKWIKL